MDLDVAGLEPNGHTRPATDQGVDKRAGDIEVRDRVAEFVVFRGLQFDGALADDGALVASGTRRGQFAEQSLEQLGLKETHGFGRHAKAAGLLFEALLLGHLAQVVLHLLLELA
jgi:hypothetical protein